MNLKLEAKAIQAAVAQLTFRAPAFFDGEFLKSIWMQLV